jgi:hypothetical protein
VYTKLPLHGRLGFGFSPGGPRTTSSDGSGDIDGREITWDEWGRMLMSFEGWQFKLTVGDKSEKL